VNVVKAAQAENKRNKLYLTTNKVNSIDFQALKINYPTVAEEQFYIRIGKTV